MFTCMPHNRRPTTKVDFGLLHDERRLKDEEPEFVHEA